MENGFDGYYGENEPCSCDKYADNTGYDSGAGYASNARYESDAVCVSNTGYDNGAGYVSNTGYVSDTGYVSNTEYADNTGYNSNGGYAGNTGYNSNGRYAGNTGYSSDGGYASDFGYASDNGYTSNAGYAADNWFSQHPDDYAYANQDWPHQIDHQVSPEDSFYAQRGGRNRGDSGNRGGMPMSPPPARIPARNKSTLRVDSGSIRHCIGRFTYIWQSNGMDYWMVPIQVSRTTVSGFRWDRRRGWSFTGVSLNRIDSFTCV